MHVCHVHVNLGMSAKNDNVSTKGRFMTTDKPIDVAIIGGGPAGYAAAIYAARANLTTRADRHNQ